MNKNQKEDFQTCPVRKSLKVLGSKWVFIIIMELSETRRFNELKHKIPDISEKVLIDKLKLLEISNFIIRKDFKKIPPKVEYSLTKNGKQALSLIPELRKIGKNLIKK